MHRHRTPILGPIAMIAAVGALVAASLLVLPARATPPSPEVTTTPIGMGRFTNIDTNVKTDIDPGAPTKFWRARIRPSEARISMCWRTRSHQARRSAGTATPAPAW
jgi:hypothetical protein